MRKLIITEEERKSILGLHGIIEQATTPPAQTTPTTPTQTTTPAPSTPKPMFGTPEQRAAAKAKREETRKKNYDNFIKGAYIRGFVSNVSDEEFNSSCTTTAMDEANYLNGSSMEMPDVVYRELEDGKKVKIDIKKYRKYIKNQNKKEDIGLEGLQGPNFKPTKCGISKQHAKDDKAEWSKK